MGNKIKQGNKSTSEQTTTWAKTQEYFCLRNLVKKTLFRHQYDCKDIDERTDGEHSVCFYLGSNAKMMGETGMAI